MTAKEQLFKEIQTALTEEAVPSAKLKLLSEHPLFSEPPFSLLQKLKETEQSPLYHPEGNVWNHTMLVVDEAANQKQNS